VSTSTETLLQGTCSRVGQYVRGDCADCSATGVLLYDAPVEGTRLVCSSCYRVYPRDTRQTCDECGAVGNVWRDPIPRKNRYLCMRCHDPEAMFINRWANKARESYALGLRERPKCELAGYGTPCKGEVRYVEIPNTGGRRGHVCNFHRGKKSANEANN